MATGPEMLMKALGIDPKEIIGAVEGIKGVLLAIKEGQDRIEARLIALERGEPYERPRLETTVAGSGVNGGKDITSASRDP